MTVLTDEIGVIGSIATAIAVVVAVVQYIQGQKSSRVQRDHEIADKLRGDLRQVAQLTLSLKEILREGLPLIRGSASIAKEFCLRLGENAVPKTFLEKIASLPPLPPLENIASLPPSEERDPFVLL